MKFEILSKIAFYTFLILSAVNLNLLGQTDECLACHDDDEMTYERNGKEIPLYVSTDEYQSSVHADIECVDCHEDFNPEELPHREGDDIYKVDCSNCHDTEAFESGIHSKGLECFDCHSKHQIKEASTLTGQGATFCISCHKSASVKGYLQSVHYKKIDTADDSPGCYQCHGASAHEVRKADFSENELHKICGECHDNEVKKFENSLHGHALASGKFLAPNCIHCHNSHKIISSSNPQAKTYRTNIPALCGDCHKDGTKVSELRTISQRHILENYKQSIHGDGLFNKGLLVTAVCSDCHFTHNILPHEDASSSINRSNIASTCMQCHAKIEDVHKKVIRGELWEKQPHTIPVCIDCHQPHIIRQVFYEQDFTNTYCMSCHKNKELTKTVNGEKKSLYVDIDQHNGSAHKNETCIRCHTNVSISKDPVCKNSGKVDCSICHAEHVENYTMSQHGILHAQKNENAPYCTDCHGVHDILKKDNPLSPTFVKNIPNLCGNCHREGEKAALVYRGPDHEIIKNYSMSIHGKGLLQSGLTVTATCVDCHTTHGELPVKNPLSSVNPHNIAETCSKCHLGIYEQYKQSVHGGELLKSDKEFPGCADCHQSHTIERVSEDDFRQGIINQCGRCHTDVTDTYFDTFHGKVSKLGSIKTARCYDCHGAHNILPPSNPKSMLSRQNIVETCKSCHPNSNRKFVGYLTHATHHDRDKYPFLYYTFWAMTILLVSTFTFFGLHTFLWLPRALAERRKKKKENSGQNGK